MEAMWKAYLATVWGHWRAWIKCLSNDILIHPIISGEYLILKMEEATCWFIPQTSFDYLLCHWLERPDVKTSPSSWMSRTAVVLSFVKACTVGWLCFSQLHPSSQWDLWYGKHRPDFVTMIQVWSDSPLHVIHDRMDGDPFLWQSWKAKWGISPSFGVWGWKWLSTAPAVSRPSWQCQSLNIKFIHV